jgi:hypothetical protein
VWVQDQENRRREEFLKQKKSAQRETPPSTSDLTFFSFTFHPSHTFALHSHHVFVWSCFLGWLMASADAIFYDEYDYPVY